MSPLSLEPQATENGTMALWSCVCVCVSSRVWFYACVCVYMKPLAQECLRMCLYSCVGVHLSVVATAYLHLLNQIHLKVKYFLFLCLQI